MEVTHKPENKEMRRRRCEHQVQSTSARNNTDTIRRDKTDKNKTRKKQQQIAFEREKAGTIWLFERARARKCGGGEGGGGGKERGDVTIWSSVWIRVMDRRAVPDRPVRW